MNRLPFIITLLRIPFSIFMVYRIFVVTAFGYNNSPVVTVAFFLVHVAIFTMVLKNSSNGLTFFAKITLVIVEVVLIGDAMFSFLVFTTNAITRALGSEKGSPLNYIFCLDTIGFFIALLTIWLQQWEKKYQASVDLIDDSNSAPRVIFAKKLTENKDGFFEESYGHLHFQMNGRTLASYSY
ncbi:hypothetical protein L5515_004640 [Caenorhabditis briggsae]|uniref:Uncharacterized protein n=1 Tax=Caenorhabditis briggsae TaxID=6238 RepID=A0AAE9ELD0_CAEBR|nr:hypothetical protein L5515_004640 [Caenorhabditis briggsae]